MIIVQLTARAEKFSTVTTEQGLASNLVRSIYQDRTGYIWVGTYGGLFKYDGYQLTATTDQNGTVPSDIRSISEDQQGRLWVGTANSGLYYKESDQLHLTSLQLNDQSIGGAINDMFVDVDQLWLGTSTGLWLINLDTLKSDLHMLPQEKVSAVIKHNHHLLILTSKEILQYNPKNERLSPLVIKPLSQAGVNNDLVVNNQNQIILGRSDGLYQYDVTIGMFVPMHSFFEEMNVRRLLVTESDLWVGTIEQGLFRYDLTNEHWLQLNQDANNIYSFPGNHVFALYQDKAGMIWVGTFENGLVYFAQNQLDFNWTHMSKGLFDCANSNVTYGFLKQGEVLWVATEKGLVKVNFEASQCQLLTQQHDGLSGNYIKSIRSASDGSIWVASTKGLDRLNEDGSEVTNVSKGLGLSGVAFSHELNADELLVGTNNGLFVLRTEQREVYEIVDDGHRFDQAVYYGLSDHQDEILLFSNKGLAKLDSHKKMTPVILNGFESTPLELVTAVLHVEQGFWLAANDRYVLFVDQELLVTDYTEHFKQAGNRLTITGMLEDVAGNLWFSGSNGIWFLDRQSDDMYHFNAEDGLQSNQFKMGSFYQDSSGVLYFGGNKGFNYFHPYDIKLNQDKPDVVITQLSQLNTQLNIGDSLFGGFVLEHTINELQGIELGYQDISVSFEFAALSYRDSKLQQYAYRLLNFNDQWTYTGFNQRVATYTNLKPGSYEFQVMSANNNDIWSEPKTLSVQVKPAPWLSPWAYVLYALAFVVAVFSFIRYRTASARKRAVELEIEVNERTQELKTQKQMVESLLDHKNELFANVTHEFKTPLALIKGPTEQLLEDGELYPHRSKLRMIKRNANRLLVMVGQILKLSEVEQEKAVVRENQAVYPVLNMLFEAYKILAHDKNIELKLNNQSEAQIYATGDFLDMVVGNLLSNAIKFSSVGGQVILSSEDQDGFVNISVKDSGSGIAVKDQSVVFDRFTRLDSHRNIQGTGIGLAVVKEITQANGGQVLLDSELGKGSEFTIRMPIATWQNVESHESVVLDDMVENTGNEIVEDQLPTTSKKKSAAVKLLVIEDNLDMRTHIGEILQNNYQCLFADRGKKGVAIALKEMPDIIICDVMMPEMDGFQVTRILRHDAKTSHIPIILLTALNTKESRIKGWRENIDVYLTKPFDAKELLATLNAVLNVRKILQQKTQESLTLSGTTDALDLPKQDLKFVNKIKQVIDDNYHDTLFMRPQLAQAMAVSERQLQRKVKALIDDSPMNLLRDYRLEMAAKKLSDGFQVTLVGDECGFSSVSYFAACFKKKYGMTPKKYQMTVNKK